MAEIKIEHKQKSMWPWIIGALVALLVIWGLFQLMDNDEADIAQPVITEPVTVDQGAPAADPPPAN